MTTLVYISGFPRTGTTYLHHALLDHPRFAGTEEESGAHVLWGLLKAGQTIEDKDTVLQEAQRRLHGDSDSMQVFLSGFHLWKTLSHRPGEFMDMLLTLPGKNDFVVGKTPEMISLRGFPEEYGKQTSVFDDIKIVLCRRNLLEIWNSACKLWPSWGEVYDGPESLRTMYEKFYSRGGAFIVEHEEMRENPQRVLDSVGEWLGCGSIQAQRPFKVSTYVEA